MQILNDPRAGPPLQGDARFAMPEWVVVTWLYANGCIPPWQRSVIGVCDLGHKLLAKPPMWFPLPGERIDSSLARRGVHMNAGPLIRK